MKPESIHSDSTHYSEVDPCELQLFLVELREWVITGGHHMHKS